MSIRQIGRERRASPCPEQPVEFNRKLSNVLKKSDPQTCGEIVARMASARPQ
jgi:hypothetical protein